MVGAKGDSKQIAAQVIADGVHVHPAALALLLQPKGPDPAVRIVDMLDEE